MENTRSYLSRFGGLGLFIIALLIVGVLVWLTVQSANDDGPDTAANENDAEQQENAFTDGNSDEADEDADGVAGNQDDDAAVSDDEESDESGVAGTDDQRGTEGSLPNTGPESTVLSFLGVIAIAWMSLSYRQSQHELAQSQK